MQNHSYTIRWTQIIPQTFMYGSRLQFNHNETIFRNRLMPSGIVIHEWKMMTDYAEDKTIPTLPILQRGESYHFSFDYDVEPKTGVYFKIIFKRRNGTVVDTRIIQHNEATITYPVEAFTYELQMINAAATYVCFKTITIQRQHATTTSNSLHVSRIMNEDQTLPVVNIIFTEAQSLSADAIREFENVIKVEHWQHCTSEMIYKTLSHLKGTATIHCIGYHAESSGIAYKMAKMLNGTAFVTHHFKHTDDEPHVICYTREVHDINAHTCIVQELLNPSRYLNDIDIDILNGGRCHEY